MPERSVIKKPAEEIHRVTSFSTVVEYTLNNPDR